MSKKAVLFIGVGIAVVASASAFLLTKKSIDVTEHDREAVFLTSGQVYFGDITSDESNWIILRDVYYLKPEDSAENPEQEKMSLIKFGQEIYGPTDKIYLNKDHILYYEKMRPDSKINEAIEKNKNQN